MRRARANDHAIPANFCDIRQGIKANGQPSADAIFIFTVGGQRRHIAEVDREPVNVVRVIGRTHIQNKAGVKRSDPFGCVQAGADGKTCLLRRTKALDKHEFLFMIVIGAVEHIGDTWRVAKQGLGGPQQRICAVKVVVVLKTAAGCVGGWGAIADHHVIAVAARDQIVACAAIDLVIAAFAMQAVIARCTQQIILPIAACDEIIAIFAAQIVIARLAVQAVIARAARHKFIAVAANHQIVAVIAAYIVGAVAAKQAVVARIAFHVIMAIAAKDHIVAAIAAQVVITCAAINAVISACGRDKIIASACLDGI